MRAPPSSGCGRSPSATPPCSKTRSGAAVRGSGSGGWPAPTRSPGSPAASRSSTWPTQPRCARAGWTPEPARGGSVDGIVTCPLNKEAVHAAGFPFPGHTEMLADLLGVPRASVFTAFILDRLRIFFLTRHHSLREAIERIDTELVVAGLRRVDELSRQIGIAAPRIALAALNPHAGENGLLGAEEKVVLAPAVAEARRQGVDVSGPVPADAVFFQCREGRYDAVLSLYHDQGHIAAKTVDFFGTVSVTLGLPLIRASVDHGTAFDIAGKWVADARGQVAALRVAAELAPFVLARSRV